jgi:hypothetical protein
MSSDEQTIVAQHQTLAGEATADDQASAGPEDQMTRFRRVALPLTQWKAGRRPARGVAAAIARILAGVGLYCLPAIALCIAIGALGYFMWVVIDVARSAGTLDFSRVGDAFGHFDEAARVLMASVGYMLLALTLYLLAAAVRAGEAWLPLAMALIIATPVILFFTLSLDLAFSVVPANLLPVWSRGAIEAVVLAHTIFLAVLLRGRRPIMRALNQLAFTRRYDAERQYTGELPRLHVIRFASGAPAVASDLPPFPNPPVAEPPVAEPPVAEPPVAELPANVAEASATETSDAETADVAAESDGVEPKDDPQVDLAPPADREDPADEQEAM